MIIINAKIVTPTETIDSGWLKVDGDVIEAIGPMSALPAAGGEERQVDAGGGTLLPGFIDVHVHGGAGAQCNTADPDEIRRVAAFHARHGTTALLATTLPAPVEALVAAGEAIRAVAGDGPNSGEARVLGIHHEGPFLNPARAGAIDPAHFVSPDRALAERLVDGGTTRLVTLAPELDGAGEVIRAFTDAGTVVSLGHSDATYDQARAAVANGARSATHTYNAMRPFHHREPGLVGAALDFADLYAELICDGVHVQPAAVRVLVRAKGVDRVVLITDAIAAAGQPDGRSTLGDRAIEVRQGRATLPGTDQLAGSTLTMDEAVRNVIAFTGVTVEEAARMASTTPATVLGVEDRHGAILPGRDADLVVLEEDLSTAGVLVRGDWVRRPR